MSTSTSVHFATKQDIDRSSIATDCPGGIEECLPGGFTIGTEAELIQPKVSEDLAFCWSMHENSGAQQPVETHSALDRHP